jgi:hypothetical protein
MWVKKTQLEIEEENKIKKSKRFKNALIDSSVIAFVFFVSQIILLKIIGHGGKYSNNIEESLAWTEFFCTNFSPEKEFGKKKCHLLIFAIGAKKQAINQL